MIHVWPQRPDHECDAVRVSAMIEARGRQQELWYMVPAEWYPAVTQSADPFAIATVFLGMQSGDDVRVDGTVSPSLLANLDEFVAVWSTWFPDRYAHIEVSAGKEGEAMPVMRQSAIAAFSGGLDSCYTVHRHAGHRIGRRSQSLGAAVMVHGFDVKLEDTEAFHRASTDSRRVLANLGVPLVAMATNWRALQMRWVDAHGSALASVLSLFAGGFGVGLIGSTEPYGCFIPWGSNPLTDTMLSSSTFRITHDGAERTRIQKLASLLDWPEALVSLRICWEANGLGGNCGRCEKCIRTILCFRVLGSALPPCFPCDVRDSQIAGVPIQNMTQRNEFASIVTEARVRKMQRNSWVRTLEARLQKHDREVHREHSFPRRALRQLHRYARVAKRSFYSDKSETTRRA